MTFVWAITVNRSSVPIALPVFLLAFFFPHVSSRPLLAYTAVSERQVKMGRSAPFFAIVENSVCAYVLYHLLLNEMAVSETTAIKLVLVGSALSAHNHHPCPCLPHFLVCNPEQGLWDRVAVVLFY